MNRLSIIDQLRALSIFFIVYGHNDYSTYFSDFLTTFSLPLFFILSGFLARDKRQMTLKECGQKYATRLLIPYFTIAFGLFLFWFFLGRHFGDSATQHFSPIKNFAGIFYAQGGPQFMDWGIPIWFLPALFCVIMIDYFISKTHKYFQVALTLSLPVLGYYTYKISGIHLPWSLDVAMVVYLYYYSGKLLQKVDLQRITDGKEWLFITVPFILHFGIAHFSPSPSFYYGEYGILPLTYITGLLGFVWLFSILKLLPVWNPIVWVGQNTLPILAFHILAMTFIKSIAIFIFNTQINFNFWNSLGLSVLQILLLVPVILFLNNHLPFLTGKADQRKDLKKHPDKAI